MTTEFITRSAARINRTAALADGLLYYRGSPCIKRHDSPDYAIRYSSCKDCVQCHRERPRSVELITYRNMLSRCYNVNHPSYKHYGARGIVVCEGWRKPGGRGFAAFLADLGPKPAGCTLERTNNNGDYSTANCRWSTRLAQNRNKRDVVLVQIEGRHIPLSQAARESGIDRTTLYARARRLGITPTEALARHRAGLAPR